MSNPKKARIPCLICGKEPARPLYKYCSNACQLAYQRANIIKKWKAGTISGLNTIGLVSNPIKRYLRQKYENKCCLCGWSEVNLNTGVVPLVADHIDGDWKNNIEKNLRLICPNCDSLTSSYAGSNKGKGRPMRALSKRAAEGKALARYQKL
jgi:hypothetical protein